MEASSRVAYSYIVECNKTRSSSTGSDHKLSSNASGSSGYHAKRTSFSHSTAAKHATSAKTKGVSLNLSQRVKLYCLAEEKSLV